MKRILAIAAGAAVVAGGIGAMPAAAHYVSVSPPSGTSVDEKWAGSPFLPGAGKGLIAGGPGGAYLISPSHALGLNTACNTIRSNGKAAVDIYGPPSPAGCAHGT
jgi:hypothetical protein